MSFPYTTLFRSGLFDIFVTHLTSETHTLWSQKPRGMFQDRTMPAGPDPQALSDLETSRAASATTGYGSRWSGGSQRCRTDQIGRASCRERTYGTAGAR